MNGSDSQRRQPVPTGRHRDTLVRPTTWSRRAMWLLLCAAGADALGAFASMVLGRYVTAAVMGVSTAVLVGAAAFAALADESSARRWQGRRR